MKKIILTLLLITLFYGCDVSSDSVNNTTESGAGNSGSTVVVSRGKLYDANNVLIGHEINTDERGILLVTSTGYMLKFLWDGEFDTSHTYYTSADGAGTAFVQEVGEKPYSKMCYYSNSKYYTFRDVANGVGVGDQTITTYASSFDGYDSIMTNHSPANSVWAPPAYALKEIQISELGLPTTITGPLTIKFD